MENNNDKHALWLPKRSIEAILAIMLTVAAITAVFKPVAPEALAAIFAAAGTAWGFYFGVRAGETKPEV